MPAVTMTSCEWFQSVVRIVNGAVEECWPRSWAENVITDRVLTKLTVGLPDVRIGGWSAGSPKPGADPFVTVQWDAFKLSGSQEYERGDIAIVVRTVYADGSSVDGVGYLEAKRIYPKSGSFDGIRQWEQLERMCRTSRHHHILLYDNESVSLGGDFPSRLPWLSAADGALLNFGSPAIVVPTDYLLVRRRRDRAVYAQGSTLASQLCLRYICGYDLEYEKDAVLDATGFLESIGGPQYLLVAMVRRFGAPSQFEEVIVVNGEKYRRLHGRDSEPPDDMS